MSQFCYVALPVPLDTTCTYRVHAGELLSNSAEPVVGGRVLVPFRQQRLSGVVVPLHDREPRVDTKAVLKVLDSEPLLDASQMRLARWIADYYIAPIGEVLRTMLPLAAEFQRTVVYRITDAGLLALHQAGMSGSSKRLRHDASEQVAEFAVLDYLAERDGVREPSILTATDAHRRDLETLVRRKWIAREDVSGDRNAARTVKFAVLRKPATTAGASEPCAGKHERKLNPNQRAVLDALAEAGGRMQLAALRELPLPSSSVATLARRGFIGIVEEPAAFPISATRPRRSPFEFTFPPAQQAALDAIKAAADTALYQAFLLHGVTGSGKTAIYLTAMHSLLQAGRSAILLVPEIGLTPAVAADLHQIFGEEVAILHSALTGKERAEQWHRIRRGEARMVVGTRSAVFAPVPDLALIIVDEEHDSSYKQEETPRYHARDVAVTRGKISNAAVVLASATPSIESYHNTESKKYRLLELTERVERRPLPEVEVVDMKFDFQQTGEDRLFSRQLIEEVTERLNRGEQALILLNRRGYSSVVLCRSCGFTMECKNCSIAMTFHKSGYRMECHYCAYKEPVPKVCKSCSSEYINFLGAGSEKVEERLHEAFPMARIGRLDRDTVRTRHDFERVLNQFHAGEINLLVGTQLIAKGHDVHGVTLVGVVGADYALGFPDFRAAERTFQLLTQVAGRAGRGETPGKV